jgi:3-phenylpropionate/trans-cinnamate dioxygenase ferredoxin reductase subunit
MTSFRYLIVGSGMTSDAAVHGIRERDLSGSIGVIGAEPHKPYNRPPLTKALWKGDALESIWRKNDVPGVEYHLGRRVTSIDPKGRRVTDDQGGTHEYQTLLLATGGEPRRIPGSPDSVIYFRTLDDYRRTRQLSDAGARFVVLGGGFIGAEIAAALRMQGRDVTMIVPEQGLGARVFPAALSKFVADYYGEKGVTVHLGDSVTTIESKGKTFTVRAKNAGAIAGDAVIAGLGIKVNDGLAKDAGLAVDDGIVVDDQLRTSHSDIYAAGDVARFMNPALGKRMRVEHEDNANTMGRIAGLNLAGAGERYDHLPMFYSDLFDLGYEAVGELDSRLETMVDWKTEFREGVVYYLEKGRVRGVLLWNTWGQVDAARALIAEPGPFTAKELKGRIG